MKSSTSCVYPIISALGVALNQFGKEANWESVNLMQETFLLGPWEMGEEEVLGIPEIESISSQDHRVINRFLAERGFSININPLGPYDIGVASVLKLVLEWLNKAKAVTLCREGTQDEYPAVDMPLKNVRFGYSKHTNHPVIIISTISGDEVCLSMVDEPVQVEELEATADKILSDLVFKNGQYGGFIFPMIDLNDEPDISWLARMQIRKDNEIVGLITQALQQTKFKMDEFGAVVESAVAIAVRATCIREPLPVYVIDKPFLAIVRRPSLSQPIFVGYLAEDCWKRPVH